MLTENVENIESKGREDAFKKLELDEASKELLKDLVMQHDKKVGYVDDLVPGKGQSLVALLHGPPGGSNCYQVLKRRSLILMRHRSW